MGEMELEKAALRGKVALVTGSSRPGGIGASIAYTLARSGAQVMITGRNLEALRKVASGFCQKGLSVEPLCGDLTSEEAIYRVVATIVERCGRLDILVNNASENGLQGDGDVVSLDVDVWDRMFATNARGTMLMMKYAIPSMIRGGGGSIVNISSGFSLRGHVRQTAYACSKAAINVLTKYAATQYGSDGIRCNTIIPGVVITKGSSEMPESVLQAYKGECLTGKLGYPVDIAHLTRFLVSDEAAYITGQELVIDGGFGGHIPLSVMEAEQSAFE